MLASEPASAIAAPLIVMSIVSLTTPHGPVGSSVVIVRVTLPVEISPEPGV